MKVFSPNSGVHEIVEAFTAALDAKHTYTRGHSDRVADIAAAMAREMGLTVEEQDFIHVAGHLHDIGKIGIPDCVLLKEGRLTREEYEIIKLHPALGSDILVKVQSLKTVAKVIRHHHERWDGGGYPDRLCSLKIPLGARIISVADAYDAMISHRTYRSQLSQDQARNEIKRCQGSQFDPEIVEAFLRLSSSEEWNSIVFKRLESNLPAWQALA